MVELREALRDNYAIVTQVGSDTVNFEGEVNAEKKLNTVQGTLTLGDPLDVESSGGQQTNFSRVTGKRYQIPYQAFDKTGSSVTFQVDMEAQIVDDERQVIDTEVLTSPLVWSYQSPRNEAVNKVHLKINGDVTNFRYKVKSLDTGQIIDSYPDKFKYANGEGADLTGAGIHAVDLYYVDSSTPNRFVEGQNLEITMEWEGAGNFLGDTSSVPYYAYDYQAFEFVNLVNEKEYAKESISTSDVYGGDLSSFSTTAVTMTAGSGRIISIDRDTGIATPVEVSWTEKPEIEIPGIASSESTRFGVDILGDAVQVPFGRTPDFIRGYVPLGFAVHPDGEIKNIVNDKLTSQELYSQFVDHLEVLGVTRKDGVDISGNVDLTINRAAGILESPGSGINSDNDGQNLVEIVASSTAPFTRILASTGDVETLLTTLIDPLNYDNGSGSAEPIPLPGNNATIQYIYQSTDDDVAGLFVAYGQTVYSSIDEAIINESTDEMELPDEIKYRTNLVARLVISRDCTSLQTGNNFQFLKGTMFGVSLYGGGTGGSAGGGDVLGPVTAAVNEIPTYADTSGKVIKATSNVAAEAGAIKTILLGGDLKVERNGNGRIIVGDSTSLPTPNTNNKIIAHLDSGANGLEVSTGSSNSVWTQYTINNNRAGATGINNGRNGIGLYHGPDPNSGTYAELNTDGFVISNKKLSVNTPEYPSGVIQANEKASDTQEFTKDVDCPIVANMTVDNGGATVAAPEPVAIFMRPGVSAEAYGNILRIDMSRYENVATNARTKVDFRLAHGLGANEGNDLPNIMSLWSDGTMRVGDFKFSPEGVLSLVSGTELYIDDYLVVGGFTTLDIAGRSHVIGELFHDALLEKIQQYTTIEDTAGVYDVGNVTAKPTTGAETKLAIFTDSQGTNLTDIPITVDTPAPEVVNIRHVGSALNILGNAGISDTFNGVSFKEGKIGVGALPSDGDSINLGSSQQSLKINSGTTANRDLIPQPKSMSIYGNTSTGHVEYRWGNAWHPIGNSLQSLHLVMGASSPFISNVGPIDVYDVPITTVPLAYYKIDGVNGNAGDVSNTVYTFPSNAPTGNYKVSIAGGLVPQSSGPTNFDGDSLYRFRAIRNGVRAGFQVGGDLRLPLIQARMTDGAFFVEGTNWFTGGDVLSFSYDCYMGSSLGSDPWFLAQFKIEVLYMGPE